MSDTSPNQRSRLIDDAGEKIGGARKDWRENFMDVADLDQMTAAEAVELVKKDNVWPQPDWEKVVSEGMSANAAALVKIIRDRLGKTPRFLRRNQDPAEVRRLYIEMMSLVRETLMAARSVEDVKGVYNHVVETLGAASLNQSTTARDKFFSVCQGKKYPLIVSFDDTRKAKTMVSEGFPAKVPTWRKGVKTYPSKGGVILIKSGVRISDQTFENDELAWKWLSDNASSITPKKPRKDDGDGLDQPVRPHLEHLQRSGLPDHRNGGDVSAEDFIQTFGFRAVEFGLWLPDDERQRVLNLAYDALHDLAEVLDWDPSRLSLDGTLAVAFGARGSGKHAAHYEPGRKVVNLTRLKGAGSVAHEFGHAFDNWAGEVDQNRTARDVLSGTGWRNRINNIKETLTNLTLPQAEAWDQMVDSLFRTQMTKEEDLERVHQRLTEVDTQVEKATNYLTQELQKERPNKKYVSELKTYIQSQRLSKQVLEERKTKLEYDDPELKAGWRRSSYLDEAQKLCGKSGEYWVRPNEMFARAFESYVFDKLKERNRRSDYLVHGVEETRYSNANGFKGNPYPIGREREHILALVGRVVAEMKARVELDLREAPTP